MVKPIVRPLAVACCALHALLATASPAGAAGFEAGIADEVIGLEDYWEGVPLAGHGGRRLWPPDWLGLYRWAHYMKPSEPGEPIRVRVLWLENGGDKLVFVSLDMIGVWTDLLEEVRSKLSDVSISLSSTELMMSASHTHNGPGAVMDSKFAEITAADRFEGELYDHLTDDIRDAIQKASLAKGASELYCAGFEAPGIQFNRNEMPGHFDSAAHVLLVRSVADDAWSGAMLNFAVHGTKVSTDDVTLSGDLPAELSDRLGHLLGVANGDGAAVPVLFVNGAEGDVSPASGTMEELGDTFEAAAEAAIMDGLKAPSDLHKLDPTWTVKSQEFSLGTALLNFAGYQDEFPPARLLSGLGLRVDPWMDDRTKIFSIQLDDIRMMTFPGEPTTSLGYELRNLGKHAGARQTWVMSMTNDHKAYFTTPEEFDAGGYESINSYFGPNAGDRIVKEHCELLE